MKLTKDWISGFVDGDGCFTIEQYKGSLIRHRFCVSQDERSADVLYALKKEFGCGSVHRIAKRGGTVYNFEISKQEHIRDAVIPHFYKHPLQTKKRQLFQQFVLSFSQHTAEAGKKGPPSPPTTREGINADWFRGIVDAEGSFNASIVQGRVMPRFTLGMEAGNEQLMEECRKLVNCGSLYTHSNGFQVLQVADVPHIERRLVPFFETRGSAVLLRTIKRISFQKWRKIVRLIGMGEHLHPRGMEKIRKYQVGLNKHNQSLAITKDSSLE